MHDDGIFELDGNAIDQVPTRRGDDWDVIYAESGRRCAAHRGDGATIEACSSPHDPATARSSRPAGRRTSKRCRPSWRHTSGSVPAKDDLLDAFAAQYDNGHLYFGADRYATNGDAQIGFWFFHNESDSRQCRRDVHRPPHRARRPRAPPIPTTTTNGDILVLSNFSNGGTVPNIRVFEWYGVDDVRLLPGVPLNSLCAPALTNDVACAITSGDERRLTVAVRPEVGSRTLFSSGAFYEGGIDLEALGFGGDCFSSFLAETRSSTSITATLKDFVLGGLGECGVSVTTQVSTTSVSIGTGSVNVSDTATILGTGTVSAPNPTGTVDFYLCGPTAIDIASCDTTANEVVEDVRSDGITNPAVAVSGDVASHLPGTTAGLRRTRVMATTTRRATTA